MADGGSPRAPGSLVHTSQLCCRKLLAQLLAFPSSDVITEEMELTIIPTSMVYVVGEGPPSMGPGLQSTGPGTEALSKRRLFVLKLVSITHHDFQILSHSPMFFFLTLTSDVRIRYR